MADKIKHIRHRGHIVQKDGQNKCFQIRYDDFGNYVGTKHVKGGFPFHVKSCRHAEYFATQLDDNLKPGWAGGPQQPDFENGFQVIYNIGECSKNSDKMLVKRRVGQQRYAASERGPNQEWKLDAYNGSNEEWCGSQVDYYIPTEEDDPITPLDTQTDLGKVDPTILYTGAALAVGAFLIYYLFK